jgi:hypothetical protein
MIQRSFLYLFLAIAIISVPVFQAAHELTHVNDTDIINLVQVDDNHDQEDADFDQLCLDCLALTAFSAIFLILTIFSIDLMKRGWLRELKRRHVHLHFFLTYLTRAPPRE